MNQFPQPAFIAPVGRGLNVWRFQTAAQPAKLFAAFGRLTFGRERERAQQALATDGTEFARNRAQRIKTLFTNRQPRNIYQGSAAETAIGRKQRREEACGD